METIIFGMVAEGQTDFAILENVLEGYFKKSEIEIDFRYLQPDPDATDETNFGNWYNVLKYCEHKNFVDIFEDSLSPIDYVVIQIDTDVSEEPHYGVSKRDSAGNILIPEQLIKSVKAKIESFISTAFFEKSKEDSLKRNIQSFKDKILFAIAVDSTECWLLPLYSKKNKGKTTSCYDTLVKEIKGAIRLNKTYKDYQKASKEFTKHKTFNEKYNQNPSLKVFIESLNKIFQTL
jgi:hypothetical protein